MPFQKGNVPKHKFSSTNQPKHNGRKPALYKQLGEIIGETVKLKLSREDFTHIQQWLLERDKSELERIAKNPKTPIFIMNMITAIGADVKNGNMATIEKTYERIFGKPKQTSEVEINSQSNTQHSFDLSNMTDQELAVVGLLLSQGATTTEKDADA